MTGHGGRHWRRAIVLAFTVTAVGVAVAQVVEPEETAALAGFDRSVDAYADLRTRLEAPLPPFTASRSAASTMLARNFLASAVRAARRNAGRGAIFTAPVARAFAARIDTAMTPAERRLTAQGESEEVYAPPPTVYERVEPVFLTALPETLLDALPPLPAAIEYRFVGDDLILWDLHAEIVIDVLPDALQ